MIHEISRIQRQRADRRECRTRNTDAATERSVQILHFVGQRLLQIAHGVLGFLGAPLLMLDFITLLGVHVFCVVALGDFLQVCDAALAQAAHNFADGVLHHQVRRGKGVTKNSKPNKLTPCSVVRSSDVIVSANMPSETLPTLTVSML